MKRIAIIGGAGQMGMLFLDYFHSLGHQVVISDVDTERMERVAAQYGAETVGDNIEAVKDADIVLISVPLEETPRVIEEVAPAMRRGALMMEISSVKHQVLETLKRVRRYGVLPLSLHPLFGPGAETPRDKKIAVIPLVNPEEELKLTQEIFSESEVFLVEVDDHDRIIAVTIVFNYLFNVSLADLIREEDLSNLRLLGGPSFELQLLLCEGYLSQDSNLYYSAWRKNPYCREYMRLYVKSAQSLLEKLENKESFLDYVETLQKGFSVDPLFHQAYENIYNLIKALKNPRGRIFPDSPQNTNGNRVGGPPI